MTEQEILDNAPEGATHFGEDGKYYKVYERNGLLINRFWLPSGDCWMRCNGLPSLRSLADIKRIVELERERDIEQQIKGAMLFQEWYEHRTCDAEQWGEQLRQQAKDK